MISLKEIARSEIPRSRNIYTSDTWIRIIYQTTLQKDGINPYSYQQCINEGPHFPI